MGSVGDTPRAALRSSCPGGSRGKLRHGEEQVRGLSPRVLRDRYLPHQVVVLAQVHVLRRDHPARERPHLRAGLDPRLGEDAEPFPGDGALRDDHFRRQHQAGELLHLCGDGAGSGRGPPALPGPRSTHKALLCAPGPGLSPINARPRPSKAVPGPLRALSGTWEQRPGLGRERGWERGLNGVYFGPSSNLSRC